MTTPLSELRQASWRPDQCSMCGSLNYSPFYKDGRPYDPWIKGAPLWDVCRCDECGHKWDFTFISRCREEKRMTRDELVEKMLDSAASKSSDGQWPDHKFTEERKQNLREQMSAALSVAVEEMLGMSTADEGALIHKAMLVDRTHQTAIHALEQVFSNRRARLTKPKSAEERVTIKRGEMDREECHVTVYQDGEEACCNMVRRHAEIYRLGLIQQLKERA